MIGEPTNSFYSGRNGEHYVFALRVFLPLEESIVSIDTSIDTIRISLAFAIRCIDASMNRCTPNLSVCSFTAFSGGCAFADKSLGTNGVKFDMLMYLLV